MADLTPEQKAILAEYGTEVASTPGQMTPEQQAILAPYNAEQQLVPINQANLYSQPQPPVSGVLRSAAQGLTMGFGEEIEAMIRSALPGGPEYEEVRNQLRQQISQFREQYPGAAITAEIVGAMTTNLIPGVAAVRSGQLAKTTMPRLMGVGATEGGILSLIHI